MSDERKVDIAEVFRLGKPIDDAMNEGVRWAIEQHRRAGLPLVQFKDGRIEYVDPETAARLFAESETRRAARG